MEVTTLVELKALTKLQTVAEPPYMELPLFSKLTNSELFSMGKLAPLLNRDPHKYVLNGICRFCFHGDSLEGS